MSTRWVQIVGGPRDGQEVPYVGRVMQEPVPKPIRYMDYYEAALPPTSDMVFETREYVLHLWSDRTGRTQGRRYVLREQAKGLGVE